MKTDTPDEERAAQLRQQQEDIRRQRNPLKDHRRTTGSAKAVIQKPPPVSTPRGPCRDKDTGR